MEENAEKRAAGVGDSAVRAKTGRGWEEWFAILDAAGVSDMDHKSIVAYLTDNYQVEPWWRQMITVAYEQERGLREKYETPKGYQASRSKIVAVPVEKLYDSWADEGKRAAWLPEGDLILRKMTPNRSMRITLGDGSRLEVNFYSKGETKSQVTIQQTDLQNAEQVNQAKALWGEALDRLKQVLES